MSQGILHAYNGKLDLKIVKTNSTEKYVNNRVQSKKNQISLWKNRRESGLIRLLERLLIGVNISDRLGGDGRAIRHLSEVSSQFKSYWRTGNQQNPLEDDGIVLSNVNVAIGSGLIKLNNGYILDDFLPHWQNLIYGGGLLSEYKYADKKTTHLEGVWTSASNTPYFYHFLIEDIARIARINEEFPQIKVAITSNQEKWKYELLEYFGFPYQVFEERNLNFQNYVTSKGGDHQNSAGIAALRKFVFGHNNQGEKSKVLITRKGLARENTSLEDAIANHLTEKGFKLVSPELLSIKDQIEIFYNATKIVGIHGGALANIIWCRPGTEIVEIQDHPYRTRDFEFLAHRNNLDYRIWKPNLESETFLSETSQIG